MSHPGPGGPARYQRDGEGCNQRDAPASAAERTQARPCHKAQHDARAKDEVFRGETAAATGVDVARLDWHHGHGGGRRRGGTGDPDGAAVGVDVAAADVG